MNDWDDIRYFLAVVRQGSVRAAAESLQVNHSTVLRRIAQLEENLNAKLFDKLPSGYRLSEGGEEIVGLAQSIEMQIAQLQDRVFGQDQSLRGRLRFAVPPSLINDLLLPHLADFAIRHPDIELDLLASYETVNLTNREADIALRLVYDSKMLPQHLYGTRLQDVYRCVYISRELCSQLGTGVVIRWIVKRGDHEDTVTKTNVLQFDTTRPAVTVSDLQAQVSATRVGLGAAHLPCFIGDRDPDLVRFPQALPEYYGTLWLLTHGETRKTRRVRLFAQFIRDSLESHADLLSGMRQVYESL